MSVFTAPLDVSDPVSVVDSLKQIGHYFLGASCTPPGTSDGLSVSDETLDNAVAVLRRLAAYLQMKAPVLVKEKLGEMLASDSEIIDQLCEGILYPFIKG